MSRKQMLVENKRRQQQFVMAHKRKVMGHKIRIRTEVIPQLRKTKQGKQDTHKKRATQQLKTQAQHMRALQRLHRSKIVANKMKIRALIFDIEMGGA